MNETTWTEPPAAEDTPPELIHELRALLGEFWLLKPPVDGYDEAVTALRVAREAVAAAVAASDPTYIAAQGNGARA